MIKNAGVSANYSSSQEDYGKAQAYKVELEQKEKQISELKKELTALRGIKQ